MKLKESHVAYKMIEAVAKLKHGRNKIQLRSFLRILNVYFRFVEECGSSAAQLNILLKKETPDEPVLFKEREAQSVETLKEKLMERPILM